jgi:hypothetical protein
MEHAFIVIRLLTKALAWIYTREKRFKNPLDKFPEV